MQHEISDGLLERGRNVMPGAVSSNVRVEVPLVVQRGQGGELFDVDGNRYVDYTLGFGTSLLGHAHPDVVAAVASAAQRGATFALSTDLEFRVAEQMVSLCPSVEMVRLCNAGTDAACSAYRIASAWTGATRVIKIEGEYNGGFDPLMYDITGVDAACFGEPIAASRGLLPGTDELVATVPFNDIEQLRRTLEEEGPFAAVFMEPILGNTAAIMPRAGYLEAVRSLCTEYSALLVFDEVKTGFRLHPGGAQALLGVESDLTMFGKAMGNGMPVAAVAGRGEYMELLRLGDVHHCGTYYGNVPATAAALAVLSLLPDLNYQALDARGRRLAAGLCEILADYGIEAHWQGVGAMFGITIGNELPTDYRSWWLDTDHRRWEAIAIAMREFGVLTDALIGLQFVSFAHTDEHLERTYDAARLALDQLAPTLTQVKSD